MTKVFPNNVFEDVDPSEFFKHNKKHVTEDFVTENFKNIGWKIYRPFVDTGIDLIIERNVCPKRHTKWDEIYNKEDLNCRKCGSELIKIVRFIQVKTREIKGNDDNSRYFGYTLKSKDFRTDPRHIFLLYSDRSLDFLLLPMYDYLKIFYDNPSMGETHFQTPSFRQNNNKLNSLQMTERGWFWKTRTSNISFANFLNENGLNLIMNPEYDLKLKDYIEKILKLKLDLFYNYSGGRQSSSSQATKINKTLNDLKNCLPSITLKMREDNRNRLNISLSKDLKRSINEGYLIKFKNIKLV